MAAAAPLTHHDILELVGPFTQCGLQLDLPASDRIARRLLFKPRVLDDAVLGTLQEALVLESLGTGTCTLTRKLTLPTRQSASLEAMGPQPAALLHAVLAVPAQRHFQRGDGFLLARSYALEAFGSPPIAQGATLPLRLTQGELQCEGLTLKMTVSRVRNVPADLALSAAAGLAPVLPREVPPNDVQPNDVLPEDLLAVLGWNWARLVPSRDGWTSRMRLRGDGPLRTARAEAALDRAAAHLARTLTEPPARFHDRHLAARWGVVFRRGIPVLTPLALLAAILAMPRFDTDQNPVLALLLYHVPTLLIAGSFCVQELPRLEIPPLPRRATAPSWGTLLPRLLQRGVPLSRSARRPATKR